jgi:hypothetical protein
MPPLKPNSQLSNKKIFIKLCCPLLGLCSTDDRLNNVKGNGRIIPTENRNTWIKMLVSLCSPQISHDGQVTMGKNFADSRSVLYKKLQQFYGTRQQQLVTFFVYMQC